MTKQNKTTLNDKQESPHFEELMDETLIISRVTREGPGYETDLNPQITKKTLMWGFSKRIFLILGFV